MIRADRQMKGVAGAKIELELVGKPRSRAKVFPLHREGPKAFGAQAGECRKRSGAIVRAERALSAILSTARKQTLSSSSR